VLIFFEQDVHCSVQSVIICYCPSDHVSDTFCLRFIGCAAT